MMRIGMPKLSPHHRIHIPNGLAMFAAVLLLVTSVVSYNSGSEDHPSGVAATSSAKAESTDNDSVNDTVERKRRALNLGLLLFRRG